MHAQQRFVASKIADGKTIRGNILAAFTATELAELISDWDHPEDWVLAALKERGKL